MLSRGDLTHASPVGNNSSVPARSAGGQGHVAGRVPYGGRRRLTVTGVANADVFVRHPVYGVGKYRKGESLVRFFDAPTTNEVVLPVKELKLPEVLLERHHRVWCHDGGRWLVGFVDGCDARGTKYLVNFPNGRSLYVETERLYARWSQPVGDPVALLKAGTVETRYLHGRRTQFVGDVLRQRAAARGLTGLWSAGIELHAHQIGAARRVLADPVKRYLLADEVGLGKTVEAGAVLRQLLADEAGEALVIVPDGLIEQWRTELTSKFRLDQFPDRVHIVPHSDIEAIEPVSRLLVVLDEAHRVAAGSDACGEGVYSRLCEITQAASGLLLLSATPVRSNEDGFLRMLHLLDPAGYPLDGLEQFRHRVAIRDDLAQALAALSDDTPVMFLREPSEMLRQLLPGERWLQDDLDVLDRLIEHRDADGARAICHRVRVQLAETHRIHRRLIRARRTASLARLFPVRGRTLGRDWLLADPDPRRPRVLEMIDNLLMELPAIDGGDRVGVFRTFLGRAMAPTVALADLAKALRAEGMHDLDDVELASLAGFAGAGLALSMADEIDTILEQDSEVDRFTAMIAWAWPYVGGHRVAVTCSFPATAEIAASRLEAQFGRDRVVRLLSTMSATERAEAARRFVEEPSRAVIVIDRGGEEGVNLQVVENVLHLDLPINIARIEQRLGRFDRWAEQRSSVAAPVLSTAFREQTDLLDAHLGSWRRGLDEALSLFGESSATLQYVVPAVERQFLVDAIEDGLAIAGDRMAAQRDSLEAQRRRIEGQDLLDAIEDRAEDQQFADDMRTADNGEAILEKFRGYVVQILGLTETPAGDAIRFGISTKHPPRVTESEVHTVGPENLRRRYAPLRGKAVGGAGFLRYGEPLVDRFAELAMRDDRGRAFAIEVHQPHRPSGSVVAFFMFSVVIAADSEPIEDLRADDPAAAAAAAVRLSQVFTPRLERMWWTPEHGEPPERVIRALDSADGDNLGSRPDRFDDLTRHRDWPTLCDRVAREAFGLMAQRSTVRAHVSAASRDAHAMCDREEAIVQARRNVGADASSDPRVLDAVRAAADAPQLTLDSCGVVFVTGPEA